MGKEQLTDYLNQHLEASKNTIHIRKRSILNMENIKNLVMAIADVALLIITIIVNGTEGKK